MQRAEPERPNGPTAHSCGRNGLRHVDRSGVDRRFEHRDDQADGLITQAPQSYLEHGTRRGVKPLKIIDGDDERGLLGEGAENVEHGQTNRMRVRDDISGLLEEQRHFQRSPARHRQRRENFCQHG